KVANRTTPQANTTRASAEPSPPSRLKPNIISIQSIVCFLSYVHKKFRRKIAIDTLIMRLVAIVAAFQLARKCTTVTCSSPSFATPETTGTKPLQASLSARLHAFDCRLVILAFGDRSL